MKVLLVNYRYFVSGGPERYLFNLSSLLAAHGHETVPFSVRYDRNEPTEYSKYFVAPLSDESEVYFKDQRRDARSIRKTMERAFYSPEVYRSLASLIEAEKPDAAVVLHYLRKLSPAVIKCLHEHAIPFAVRLSDFGMVCPNAHLLRDDAPCELCVTGSLLNSVRYRCVQGSLAASAVNYAATQYHRRAGYFDLIPKFLVPSTFTREKMLEAGWPETRLVHLPTFVEVGTDASTHATPATVVYVGRLEHTKGVHVLLEAVLKLSARDNAPSFTLRVVGDGDREYATSLKDFVARNDLQDVTFDGALSAADVRSALRAATCSVAPSLWYENMPNSVLESLAEATPVIASDHGSLRELIEDGITGRLVRPGDPVELADALFGMLTDAGAIAKMGRAGLEFVAKHHSPDRHYEILMDVLTSVGVESGHSQEQPAWT